MLNKSKFYIYPDTRQGSRYPSSQRPHIIEKFFIEHPEYEKETIFYSTEDGYEWINYSQHFTLNDNGVINLLYKSIDENGNIENEHNQVININTQNLPTKKIKVTNSVFQTE